MRRKNGLSVRLTCDAVSMGRMWVTANALLEFSMRAFIPCKDHVPYNVNFYSAWLGFSDMGFETIPYFDPSELLGVERGDVVVGGSAPVKP